MMMTFITQGGEDRGEKIRRGKLRKAKAEALKRGLVARSCARSGRKDVVGEVKGIEMMSVRVTVTNLSMFFLLECFFRLQ